MLARGGLREEGERHIRESLDLARRRLGYSHPITLRAKNALAALYYDHRFKLAQAEALYLEALAQQSRAFGEAHPACARRAISSPCKGGTSAKAHPALNFTRCRNCLRKTP